MAHELPRDAGLSIDDGRGNLVPVRRIKPKPIHRAKLISPDGRVSPLCAAKPRAINLKRASWSNRDEAVTCPRCLKIIAERARSDHR